MDDIAEVECLDGAVEEVGDDAVEQGPRCGRVSMAEEQGAELLEAEEEGVDEAARLGEGEDVVGSRGREEVVEEMGGAALEGVGGVVGRRRREGVDLVLIPAERPGDGAADGGQRRGRRRRGIGGRHCASHRGNPGWGLGRLLLGWATG